MGLDKDKLKEKLKDKNFKNGVLGKSINELFDLVEQLELSIEELQNETDT